MAQIIKREGMWYSDFRQGGKRIRRALSPYKDRAEVMLKDLLAVRVSEQTGKTPDTVSWLFFREKYLKQSKLDKKPKTYWNDERAFNMVEKYGAPLLRLGQMTPGYLDDFRLKCKEAKVSDRTASRWIRTMKTAMHKAEFWDLIPLMAWKKVKCMADRKRKDHLSFLDFQKVLTKCAEPYQRAAMLMGWAGLRRAEVQHLEWSDIDFKGHVIKVQAKEGWGKHKEDWAPKGSKPGEPKEREVDMTPTLEKYLLKVPPAKRTGLVMIESVHPDVFSRYFMRLGTRLKIKLFPHMLRHTCASFLISTGSTLPEVGELLGQDDLRSTDIYTHMLPRARRIAVDRMDTGMHQQGEDAAGAVPEGV